MKQKIMFILFTFLFTLSNQQVRINEILTNNINNIQDSYGNYSSWAEIYNYGKKSIDISGYGLSNEDYLPFKWRFPKGTILNSGEYLLVFISDKKSKDKELHTNFELNKEGDLLFFSNSNAELIEKIKIPSLKEDESYGRTENNKFQKMIPSPGKKNIKEISPPKFSKESGFYESDFLLTLSSVENCEIYYTIDSTDPLKSESVQIYKEPIKIYDRSGEPNFYSEIGDDPESPLYIGTLTGYNKPKYLLDKAMVIRAYCKNEEGQSQIISHSYFVTTGSLSQYKETTVVSIITNPENFFDPVKGIYVVGYDYLEEKKKLVEFDINLFWQIMESCNYSQRGKKSEREVNIAIFEKGTISLHQNMGLRIKGASTRSAAGKSFNIYARDEYGKGSINTALFSDNYNVENKLINKYKSFSLRSVYDDERIRDEFVSKILFGREYQSISDTKKCILFINGEYWGLYIMMEKFSENYFENHFNVPKNDVVLAKEGEIEASTNKELVEYTNFMKTYSKKDLSQKNIFNEINSFLDIYSLIEYFVIGIYLGTWDWPNHNDGIWKNIGIKFKNNPYTDGRWRYLSFDFDFTMGKTYMDYGGLEGYQYNNFKHMERDEERSGYPNDLFIPLLHNEQFKNEFSLMFCDYANEVTNIDKITNLVNDYKNNYIDMLANGQLRWKGNENCTKEEALERYKNIYIENFDSILVFFKERPKYAFGHMKEYLNLTGEVKELTVLKEGKGKIKINTIIPEFKDGKWVGQYFTDLSLKITAIPDENSIFKGWSEDVISDNESIIIKLNEIEKIKANFEYSN